ncbi:MAG: DUF84 family protein [Candidatus Pacebacteria bacterium]|nr:DUF84 family protein [Candidatus Paceibacterota bacterium]
MINQIFVGSTNPVKINAVVIAASEHWPEIKVSGLAVDSQVSEQPISCQETKTGAVNRAKAALTQGLTATSDPEQAIGIGLEGGVIIDEQGEMWSKVWAAVIGQSGKPFLASGAGFKIEPIVAEKIKAGQEMGSVMNQLYPGRNIRQQEGLIGIVTNQFVDRTEEYSAIAKLAIGLWYGRSWQEDIPNPF